MATVTGKKKRAKATRAPVEEGVRLKPASRDPLHLWIEAARKRGATKVVVEATPERLKLSDDSQGMSEKSLAELLRTFPAEGKIVATTRRKEKGYCLVWDGKLKRGKHYSPAVGSRLVWQDYPGDAERLRGLPGVELRLGAEALFPEAENLGHSKFVHDGQEWLARIFVVSPADPTPPGFYLCSDGVPVVAGDWLGLVEHVQAARLARVVVEGPCDFAEGAPGWLMPRLTQLAKLATRKSSERIPPRVLPTGRKELIAALFAAPEFLTRLELHKGQLPPIATVRQILELVCEVGGQIDVEHLSRRLNLPVRRSDEILAQMAPLLSKGPWVCLARSLDGKRLVLDQGLLASWFELEPDQVPSDRRVVARAADGRDFAVEVPVVLEARERQLLEVLTTYGKASERELAAACKTRRVGGLIENLMNRLERGGWKGLRLEGEGPDGRIYSLERRAI
ncbi:MAG: hypothetical protein KC910_02605 [Candidatus Eremiobacteraeota bacterium]|nr:hypothetical protein [Candidatus Eremiobacteraeota bacterium]